MSSVDNIMMTGAVLVSMGVLGYSWVLLIALKESIKSGIKRIEKGSGGCRSRLNLWSRCKRWMHYGENIVASQGCPTTHVIDDFNQEEYELPEQPANPHDHTKYFDARISPCYRPELEEEAMVRQIESLVKNEGSMITVLEKIADSMLARDKRIAELEDKLRDSIFILYGGKKPDVE